MSQNLYPMRKFVQTIMVFGAISAYAFTAISIQAQASNTQKSPVKTTKSGNKVSEPGKTATEENDIPPNSQVTSPKKPKKVLLSSLTIDSTHYPYTFTYKGLPYTGLAITQYIDNTVYQEYSIEAGLLNGFYKEYDEKKNLMAQETWSAGRKNGPFYYRNVGPMGNISRGYFLNDSLNGLIEGFYRKSEIPKYKIYYENGKRNGNSQTFFDNGKIEQEATFVNDIPDGIVVGYNRDGKVRSIKNYKMGVPDGIAYEFHITGCSGKEMYFKMGVQDSMYRVFDAITCNVIEEGFFKMGKKHGLFIDYNAFGDTLKVAEYSEGVLNGRYEVYVEEWNDKTKKNELKVDTKGTYEFGTPVGKWKYGFSTHLQQREGSYENGVMVGTWMFYDNKGLPLMQYKYDAAGEIIDEKYFDIKK